MATASPLWHSSEAGRSCGPVDPSASQSAASSGHDLGTVRLRAALPDSMGRSECESSTYPCRSTPVRRCPAT